MEGVNIRRRFTIGQTERRVLRGQAVAGNYALDLAGRTWYKLTIGEIKRLAFLNHASITKKPPASISKLRAGLMARSARIADQSTSIGWLARPKPVTSSATTAERNSLAAPGR